MSVDLDDVYVLHVTMPREKVLEEAKRLVHLLHAAGESTWSLSYDDFMLVAVRQRMLDLVYQAERLELEYELPKMFFDEEGNGRILFGFMNQTDAAAFKIALL